MTAAAQLLEGIRENGPRTANTLASDSVSRPASTADIAPYILKVSENPRQAEAACGPLSELWRVVQNAQPPQNRPEKSEYRFGQNQAEQPVLFSTVTALQHYQALGGELTEIRAEGRCFTLAQPLHLAVRFEEGYWTHEYPELRLFGYGRTPSDSLHSFEEVFAETYANFAEAPDEELADDAQDYKRLLRALVSQVN